MTVEPSNMDTNTMPSHHRNNPAAVANRPSVSPQLSTRPLQSVEGYHNPSHSQQNTRTNPDIKKEGQRALPHLNATFQSLNSELLAQSESHDNNEQPLGTASQKPESPRKNKHSPPDISKGRPPLKKAKTSTGSLSPTSSASGSTRSRPVKSCTHCRQQKIRCNAMDTYPQPCTRCAKMERSCIIDPFFKPQKGGQVQSLREDISSLKQQLALLQRKSSNASPDQVPLSPTLSAREGNSPSGYSQSPDTHRYSSVYPRPSTESERMSISPGSSTTVSQVEPSSQIYNVDMDSNSRVLSGDSLPNKPHLKTHLSKLPNGPSRHSLLSSKGYLISEPSASSPLIHPHQNGSVPISTILTQDTPASSTNNSPSLIDTKRPGDKVPEDHIHSSRQPSTSASVYEHADYIMGDVKLPYDKAEELHKRFMTHYLPFLPIIQSNSAAELYRQSQLLFWTVCLTASLSEPVPDLYNSLSTLIKQLAIETCWIQTPRSTHIVQALLILGNWPLPNEKVLDDCSYRFVTLAKALAMQLGLHRGKFIYEFSRTQVSLPDAEKWRTRTWISIFIAEQVWCANLGLPPNMPMDYLLEESRTDTSLPKTFRSLACLAMFCSKLVNLLGASVTSPDGTLEPKNRVSTLGILEQELDRIIAEIGSEDGKFFLLIFLICSSLSCLLTHLF